MIADCSVVPLAALAVKSCGGGLNQDEAGRGVCVCGEGGLDWGVGQGLPFPYLSGDFPGLRCITSEIRI